jgi:DNA-binding transcriptional LysR family regulator
MLDVKRMRVLREVASHGSFSAAAESLAYTQSAVSQQIAALEREVGTTLVDRNARGIRLTEAGEALVRHTDVVLARLDDAEAELEAIAGLRGGRIRLATFPTAGATLVPPAMAAFRERYPDVELALGMHEPPEGLERLRAGEYDIVLLVEAAFDKDREPDGIDRVHLLEDPMYLALPLSHPLAGRRRIRLAELAEENWMFGTQGTCPDSAILRHACHKAGFVPRVAFENDDYTAIQGFVAAGVGVAPIPELALSTVRDDIVIRSLGANGPVRHIVAASLSGGYCSPARAAMLEILKRVSAEHAAARRPQLAAVG